MHYIIDNWFMSCFKIYSTLVLNLNFFFKKMNGFGMHLSSCVIRPCPNFFLSQTPFTHVRFHVVFVMSQKNLLDRTPTSVSIYHCSVELALWIKIKICLPVLSFCCLEMLVSDFSSPCIVPFPKCNARKLELCLR